MPLDSRRSTRNNKRLRAEDSETGVLDEGPAKIKGIDKYSRMSVKQLQQEAIVRGVSAIGLKKELIDKLCVADISNPIVSNGV